MLQTLLPFHNQNIFIYPITQKPDTVKKTKLNQQMVVHLAVKQVVDVTWRAGGREV